MDHLELLDANPQYACVRYPDEREDRIPLTGLATQGMDGIWCFHCKRHSRLTFLKNQWWCLLSEFISFQADFKSIFHAR